MANFTYLVWGKARQAAVIDPGWEAANIVKAAEKEGVKISAILLTHTHFDHANAVGGLAKATGAKVWVHGTEAGEVERSGVSAFADGEVISVGDLSFKCIHTPGHTPGSTCFQLGTALFTGDTLFVDGIGRTDLEGGDTEAMMASLKKISELEEGIVIYPGHGYGMEPTSTIGEQKKSNPYMHF